MIDRMPRSNGFVVIAAAFLSLSTIGCSSSADSNPDTADPYAASGGTSIEEESGAPSHSGALTESRRSTSSDVASDPETTASGDSEPDSEETKTFEPPFSIAAPDTETEPSRQLRADLSPKELVQFLAGADKDMQIIVTGKSGITDEKKARDTLVQIVKMKLEASRRLADHPESTDEQRVEGARGELQSMSHLAALGDLKVANELEKLAKENLDSPDTALVADSRLVLIGFAIESLQNGDPDSADRIVEYVQQIADAETRPDVPAMMVMGEARHTLANYGHTDHARRVRDLIIELFADSPNPEVAQMAAQLAGNVRFDAIDTLRGKIVDGETVAPDRWRDAVETLIQESSDLQTVQYLAGAALEFESTGQSELAESTYEIMSTRFNTAGAATTREVELARAAYQARKDVIGKEFDPDLPRLDGSPLDLPDFRGQVVLMPFWAMNFPESLQLIPLLESIADSNPGDVAIVGVNLDVEGAPADQFAVQNGFAFPSFRAESSATAEVANQVAAEFGMVSMPFVAILDKKGHVAAINFTGRDLEAAVEDLIGR